MPQPWERQETVRPEKGQPARGGLGVALVLFGRWRAWRLRLQTRQALRHLSDEQLRDIGLSRAQLMVAAMQVHSRGRVALRSDDPAVEPNVDFDLLTDARDVALLQRGVQHLVELIQRPSMRAVIERIVINGERIAVDDLTVDDIAARLGAHLGGYAHAAGTCRMGDAGDPHAVVDGCGRVIGYTGLRVADASIMPDLPRANPCLTTIVIGERIAAIVGYTQSRRSGGTSTRP